MELGKPSIVSVILAVAFIATWVYLGRQATNKTDNENYAKGSTHYETHISPVQNVSPFGFSGCSPFLRIDGKGNLIPNQPSVKEPKK